MNFNFVKLVTKCKLGCDPLLGQEVAVVAVAPALPHSSACYHYFVSLNCSNLSWQYKFRVAALKWRCIFHLYRILVKKIRACLPRGMGGPGKVFHSTCSGQASTDVLNCTESPFVQLNSGCFCAFFWILLFKLDAAIRS